MLADWKVGAPYHYWKFKAAVDTLAGSEPSLRKRIEYALITMVPVLDHDLDGEVLDLWLELKAQVTWKQDGDPTEGLWRNTLAAMSDDDAQKASETIIRLFEATVRQASLSK